MVTPPSFITIIPRKASRVLLYAIDCDHALAPSMYAIPPLL